MKKGTVDFKKPKTCLTLEGGKFPCRKTLIVIARATHPPSV